MGANSIVDLGAQALGPALNGVDVFASPGRGAVLWPPSGAPLTSPVTIGGMTPIYVLAHEISGMQGLG